MKETFKTILAIVLLLCALYAPVAYIVFGFRHPWATDTERFLYTYEALTFQKVSYNQMRPRE